LNILITSASNKVWLIQAFKKALMKHGGGSVFAADIDTNKIALSFADKCLFTPKSNDPLFIPELVRLCKQENIQLIVPTRDGELKIFSENKALLEKDNIKIMVSNSATIEICQDKYKFYQYCIENDCNTIKTYLRKHTSQISFPVFVKPRKGSGSQKTFIAKNTKKLEQFLTLYDEIEFIIQPLIEEHEYTIDFFSDFNGKVISIIPRKRVEVHHGESTIGKIEKNQTIIKEVNKLAINLGLVGHNTIQCFYNKRNDQVTFIEVNPRFGGGAELGFSAGVLTPEFLIQLINGHELEAIQNDYADELWMFKYSHHVSLLKINETYCENIENNKTFCIDIDGTICTEFCRYEDAKPVLSVIEKINKLYNGGHKIILFTSRGYSSGHDWLPLLKEQMKKWGVLYHEIRQGKPFADYYIDNKAVNVLDWF